jgi:hypothetical protein
VAKYAVAFIVLTSDRARHFERSQDRVDAPIDQRQRMPDFDKRVYRCTGDQRRNRADAKNDDQEPRPRRRSLLSGCSAN